MIGDLVEAVGQHFWLHSPMGDSKVTRYEHYQSIYKQTGNRPEELETAQIPDIVYHVWEWFQELNAARSEGPISYQEIQSWARLTGRNPRGFEIQAIKAIDLKFLEHHYNGSRSG